MDARSEEPDMFLTLSAASFAIVLGTVAGSIAHRRWCQGGLSVVSFDVGPTDGVGCEDEAQKSVKRWIANTCLK